MMVTPIFEYIAPEPFGVLGRKQNLDAKGGKSSEITGDPELISGQKFFSRKSRLKKATLSG
jgi:hypothetical protein